MDHKAVHQLRLYRLLLQSFDTVSVAGHIKQRHRHRKLFPLISWGFFLVYETPGLDQTLSR